MSTFASGLTLRAAACACALLAIFAVARPARADDSLTLLAGAAPGLYDALDLVAQGAGFYKDEHLDVIKNHVANASTCAQLVATGKADICSMSVEPVLTGYEKGLRLQFFLARSAQYSYGLGVLADSPIRTLADFKGTVVGELTIGSSAEPAVHSMLAGAGLQKSDYAFVPIGSGAQALESFVDKHVAGVAMAYGDVVTFETVGNVNVRFFRHPILKDVPNVAYAATPATIGAKGPLLARFSRAIVKAALFMRENPAAAARLYLEYQVGGGPVTATALQNTTRQLTLLRDYLPAADPSNKRIGYLPPQGLELYSKLLVDYGLATQAVPVAAIATDQFIAFANDFDHRAVIALAKGMP
jgi:NitT/TauT family transport system substrate-binding protein